MNVYFGIIKNNRYVLHQPSNRKLWKNFIDGIANEIPDIIIADINDFFEHFEKDLLLEDCSEFHFWDYEAGIEKICYNLSEQPLKWTIKKINNLEINK